VLAVRALGNQDALILNQCHGTPVNCFECVYQTNPP